VDTTLPSPLLIDYYQIPQNDSTSASGPAISVENTVSDAPKKLLVMKRSTQSKMISSKSNKERLSVTAEERERAYQEARARIFAESQTQNDTSQQQSTSTPSGSGMNSPSPLPEVEVPLLDAEPEVESDLCSSDVVEESTTTKSTSSSSRKIDVSRWTDRSSERRGVVRNADVERADPDFVRRSHKSKAPPAPPLMTPTHYPTTAYSSQYGHQQQQQQQQYAYAQQLAYSQQMYMYQQQQQFGLNNNAQPQQGTYFNPYYAYNNTPNKTQSTGQAMNINNNLTDFPPLS
jgi:hypothetical protein